MLRDGFSLDDKRDRLYDSDFAGDLPKILEGWQQRDKSVAESDQNDRTASSFWVGKAEIGGNKYDLSINRYKEIVYEEEQYDPPKEILARMKVLEVEIMEGMEELEGML